ncbi:gamma-glutamyl-gamma-aminobutyrate hydrolase family protein [Enterococcus thailandicus]|uniref:gamma-glutamyl-gamma-aminobutyrate hydrolase family protein n=1 Tax=Enterococcus thailandicus TaxID=417368 RepID=UPI0022E3AFA8|nr:gamma-glutamyl-gamma-aminobutyrate hydrolase family protein [Enterococcus thailandicus]
MQPIIGIAGNHLNKATDTFQGNEVTYTPQGFVQVVKQAGGLPLVFPILEPSYAAAFISRVDKLLLAGGQDISPQLYQQDPHPKLQETNLNRDLFEQALIKEAIKQKKPIFSVCRGTQLVNVVLGGTLYQDLSLYPNWAVKHEQQPTVPTFATHEVKVSANSLLGSLLPESYFVNSYHHQAIKDLAPSLKAIAIANDGIIEAVESKNPEEKIFGVQWHPELTHQINPLDQSLFDYFVNKL